MRKFSLSLQRPTQRTPARETQRAGTPYSINALYVALAIVGVGSVVLGVLCFTLLIQRVDCIELSSSSVLFDPAIGRPAPEPMARSPSDFAQP